MIRNPRLVVLPPQHLGHEIHVGRSIVIDMLAKDVLCPQLGDCVTTGLPDRRFMYEALFGSERVFDYSIMPDVFQPIRPPKALTDYLVLPSAAFKAIGRFANFDVINLTSYSQPPTYCTFGTSEEMEQNRYVVPDTYWCDKYIGLAQRFNFLADYERNTILPVALPVYVVIHHRYSASIEGLFKIISELPTTLAKVVFTSNMEVLKGHFRGLSNLFFTDSLKAYASLLKDTRCKLLISEWSGAGQVGQYTLGSQGGIWYYYDHYPDVFNFSMTHKIWEHNAKLGNYFNCWDFKNVSGCDIQHFSSFESLLDAVRKIRVNN